MNRHTQNRLREHSGLGHYLAEVTTRAKNVSRNGQKQFVCICGWFGWLSVEEATK
jgi:hypothetical protein